jgi:hypothetical protein
MNAFKKGKMSMGIKVYNKVKVKKGKVVPVLD